MDGRVCKHCGERKVLADFYADGAARDGRRPEGKACTATRRKRWYEATREREIARVKAWQHDHRAGARRGLLCFSCNSAIGKSRLAALVM